MGGGGWIWPSGSRRSKGCWLAPITRCVRGDKRGCEEIRLVLPPFVPWFVGYAPSSRQSSYHTFHQFMRELIEIDRKSLCRRLGCGRCPSQRTVEELTDHPYVHKLHASDLASCSIALSCMLTQLHVVGDHFGNFPWLRTSGVVAYAILLASGTSVLGR
jgi:hypothetical protein